MRKLHALGVVAVTVMLATTSARAEPTAQDKAVAESLFREGRTLLTSGKTQEACSRFDESQKLDPQIGTLANLALCHETLGKTASAWAEFVEVTEQAERANDDKRAAFGKKHAQDLETKLSRVKVTLDQPAPNTAVTVGGRAVTQAILENGFPADPGEIVIEASAPGRVAHVEKAKVPVGPSSTTIRIPALALVPKTEEPVHTPPPPVSPTTSSGARTVGIVLAGVGVVGIGVGAVFGLQTLSKKDDADELCNGQGQCSQAGLDLDDEAKTSAILSTIGFGVGGAALAVGAILFFTGAKPSKSGLRAGPLVGTVNGAALGGTF